MMRRSLELGMAVVILLLVVIVSLAMHNGSSPSEAELLKQVPQICTTTSTPPRCWTVTAAPTAGATQKALSSFLSLVWNANSAGVTSVLGTYELQRCSNSGIGSNNIVCTLWSTANKSEVEALESQFVNSHLFGSVVATRS
jgi:hypothetical protein